jgi:hypothetical protein
MLKASISLALWLVVPVYPLYLLGPCLPSGSVCLVLVPWFPGLIDGSNGICDWFFCCGGPSLTSASIWLASCQLVVS